MTEVLSVIGIVFWAAWALLVGVLGWSSHDFSGVVGVEVICLFFLILAVRFGAMDVYLSIDGVRVVGFFGSLVVAWENVSVRLSDYSPPGVPTRDYVFIEDRSSGRSAHVNSCWKPKGWPDAGSRETGSKAARARWSGIDSLVAQLREIAATPAD